MCVVVIVFMVNTGSFACLHIFNFPINRIKPVKKNQWSVQNIFHFGHPYKRGGFGREKQRERETKREKGLGRQKESEKEGVGEREREIGKGERGVRG